MAGLCKGTIYYYKITQYGTVLCVAVCSAETVFLLVLIDSLSNQIKQLYSI